MKALHDLEAFSRTVNDLDDRMPKGRSRCFDIGISGGCGVYCPAFLDGECGEPQEIPSQEIIEAHGQEDAQEVFELYACFKSSLKE